MAIVTFLVAIASFSTLQPFGSIHGADITKVGKDHMQPPKSDVTVVGETEKLHNMQKETLAKFQRLEERLAEQEAELKRQASMLSNMKALFSGFVHPQNPIAFYVQKEANLWAGSSDITLPFETVKLNLGIGWSTADHQFIAPQRGVYVFTFHGFNTDVSSPGFVWIMHNGQRIQYIDVAPSRWHSASGTAIIELWQYDLVSCQLGANRFIRGEGTTHFIGFLLHPLS